MSLVEVRTGGRSASSPPTGLRLRRMAEAPRRTAPFDVEPGYYEAGALWLYGNVRLLWGRLAYISAACGPDVHRPNELDAIERDAEHLVLEGRTLVCGVHNAAHQRAALVPLRWGAPRVVVFSGGFYHHLGPKLTEEPFRAARLWRYEWDAKTDLAISRRAPEKKPTFASHNPTVDRAIALIARGEWPGLSSPFDSLTAPLSMEAA